MYRLRKLVLTIGLGFFISGCATVAQEIEMKKPKTITELVTYKANEYKINTKFAHSIIQVESTYNPKATNGTSKGLGQIKCATAKGIGFAGNCNDLFDPSINLHYSFKYLKMALAKSKENYCHAATLYNRGLYSKSVNSDYCRKVLTRMNRAA
jgi:soluble lytic murein transglycosylase-like protein